MSYSVDNPQIAKVLDMASGDVITAHRAIGDEYDRAIQLRTDLRMGIASGRPRYTCTLCGVGVYLNCMHFERRFYFKHAHEDGSCPIQTRGQLPQDEIDAIRYNGAKESWKHRQMKEWIREGLAKDPEFSEVVVEGIGAIIYHLNAHRALRWEDGLESLLTRKLVSVAQMKKACPNHHAILDYLAKRAKRAAVEPV